MRNMICFHNPDEENGYLSNWYKSDFVWGSLVFSSMEKYMMYRKALLFKDLDIASQILKTDDVARIKSLGRKVRNFNDSVWGMNKKAIIVEGLTLKFSDNYLRSCLLSTGNAILAECAVKDRIWGIGLSMSDSRRFDKTKWRGQNLLGECLMLVRDYYSKS